MATTLHFTTLEKFQDRISKLLANHSLVINATDTSIMTDRLNYAYNAIEDALMARGLTAVQISTWKRGEEYQLDIATYFYILDCGVFKNTEGEEDWVKAFDRREELKVVTVISNDDVLLIKSIGFASGVDLQTINAAKQYNP
jgi:hypothetical protein